MIFRDGSDVFLRTAIDAGVDTSRLVPLGTATVEEVIAAIGEKRTELNQPWHKQLDLANTAPITLR